MYSTQARIKLQTIQKDLYKSLQDGQGDSDAHKTLKTEADAARQELRVAQEDLAAARATLPKRSADPSVKEEAGAQIKTMQADTGEGWWAGRHVSRR